MSPELVVTFGADVGTPGTLDHEDALTYLAEFSGRLGVEPKWIRPAHEDIWHIVNYVLSVPFNAEPGHAGVPTPEEANTAASL